MYHAQYRVQSPLGSKLTSFSCQKRHTYTTALSRCSQKTNNPNVPNRNLGITALSINFFTPRLNLKKKYPAYDRLCHVSRRLMHNASLSRFPRPFAFVDKRLGIRNGSPSCVYFFVPQIFLSSIYKSVFWPDRRHCYTGLRETKTCKGGGVRASTCMGRFVMISRKVRRFFGGVRWVLVKRPFSGGQRWRRSLFRFWDAALLCL